MKEKFKVMTVAIVAICVVVVVLFSTKEGSLRELSFKNGDFFIHATFKP